MKKQAVETDFIGGQGALTKEEEAALSSYFARKKNKKNKPRKAILTRTKTGSKSTTIA